MAAHTYEYDTNENVTAMVAAEQMAADTYEKDAKEAAVAKITKEQEVKYKTKAFTGLDKKVGELTNERSGVEDLTVCPWGQTSVGMECNNGYSYGRVDKQTSTYIATVDTCVSFFSFPFRDNLCD